MLKKFLFFAGLALAVTAILYSQTDRTTSTMMANIIQPTRHIRGDSIRIHMSSHQYALSRIAKGADLAINGTAGVLSVHLMYDAVGSWYLMPLNPGYATGAMFDKIDSTRTTVNIDSINVFTIEDY